MVTDASCPFCKIIQGGDPTAKIVFRNDSVVVFFPLRPATRGHTLVVPRRHVASLTEMTSAEASAVSEASVRAAKAIFASLAPEGMNVIQSTGQVATQSVPHVHFHLVPRWTGDRMELAWPADEAEDAASQDLTLASIRAGLAPEGSAVSPEDRRQHLSFIQAVITRMSQASSSSKSWLLPIVSLTYGYAITQKSWPIALLGLLSVFVFGTLDANYLKQERAFRALYDQVAGGSAIPAFSMNPSLASPAGSRVNYWPDWRDLRSWAILPVHGPLALCGAVIAVWLGWS